MKKLFLILLSLILFLNSCANNSNKIYEDNQEIEIEKQQHYYNLFYWQYIPYLNIISEEEIQKVWTNDYFYSINCKSWWELVEIHQKDYNIGKKFKRRNSI